MIWKMLKNCPFRKRSPRAHNKKLVGATEDSSATQVFQRCAWSEREAGCSDKAARLLRDSSGATHAECLSIAGGPDGENFFSHIARMLDRPECLNHAEPTTTSLHYAKPVEADEENSRHPHRKSEVRVARRSNKPITSTKIAIP